MERESIDFSLSIENLESIPFHKYEKNFTFIVNGERYGTSRYVADLLSPALRKMHFTDKSVKEFTIDVSDLSDSQKSTQVDYFKDFLNLVTFTNSTIDVEHQKHYMEYFYVLGNIDEYSRIRANFFPEITNDNSVQQLITMFEMSSNIPQEFNYKSNPLKEVISYIANNFEEVDKYALKKLNFEIIEEILQNESLRLNNEDSLLKFILTLYQDDHSYSGLFEYVHFENVTDDCLYSFIDEFEVHDINQTIWNSICARLLPSKKKQFILKRFSSIRYIPDFIEFKCEKGKEFEGIMRYLSKEANGKNLHDEGIVGISSNSILMELYHPKNVVDYDHNTYYHSGEDDNAFVLFDFKEKLVQIKSYSIKSMNNTVHYSHLKNWVLEVSNDNVNWRMIDAHANDRALDGPGVVCNFTVKKKDNDFHRFVRIRQTGKSWDPRSKKNFFGFYFVEFFGRLIMNESEEEEEEEEEIAES